MGRLGKHAHVAHLQADIPCLLAVLRTDDDGVQQTLAAHLLDHRGIYLGNLLTENLSETVGLLHQVLLLNDLQSGDADLGGNRVSAEGGAVFARLDVQHDLVVGQNCGDGNHTATESLAQDQDVGTHALMVAGEHLAGTGYTALHLIRHEKHVVFVADVIAFFQIALVRHVYAGLALDGLH